VARSGWDRSSTPASEGDPELLADARPELVITDLRLPAGRGNELVPSDGAACSYAVVIMTSHGGEALAVEAMRRVRRMMRSPASVARPGNRRVAA
jgi:DNA-binding NarL/FixJ family response regulator